MKLTIYKPTFITTCYSASKLAGNHHQNVHPGKLYLRMAPCFVTAHRHLIYAYAIGKSSKDYSGFAPLSLDSYVMTLLISTQEIYISSS